MVDLSPSTRGAQYRDSNLFSRGFARCWGKIHIASSISLTRIGAPFLRQKNFSDLPSEKTIFYSSNRRQRLFFSPTRGLVFRRLPRRLLSPSIRCWKIRPMRQSSKSRFGIRPSRQRCPTRLKKLRNLQSPTTRPIPQDRSSSATAAAEYFADHGQNKSADDWPENDQLQIRVPPPRLAERWWIGPDAPANFKSLTPEQLPTDSAAYLAPSIIILNNTPASAFSQTQLDRLEQLCAATSAARS